MIFINIVFFLLICMLAIISRKNYSKYKNEGYIKGLFLSRVNCLPKKKYPQILEKLI